MNTAPPNEHPVRDHERGSVPRADQIREDEHVRRATAGSAATRSRARRRTSPNGDRRAGSTRGSSRTVRSRGLKARARQPRLGSCTRRRRNPVKHPAVAEVRDQTRQPPGTSSARPSVASTSSSAMVGWPSSTRAAWRPRGSRGRNSRLAGHAAPRARRGVVLEAFERPSGAQPGPYRAVARTIGPRGAEADAVASIGTKIVAFRGQLAPGADVLNLGSERVRSESRPRPAAGHPPAGSPIPVRAARHGQRLPRDDYPEARSGVRDHRSVPCRSDPRMEPGDRQQGT